MCVFAGFELCLRRVQVCMLTAVPEQPSCITVLVPGGVGMCPSPGREWGCSVETLSPAHANDGICVSARSG